MHVSAGEEHKPRLSLALSWPVVVCGVMSLAIAALLAVQQPIAIVLGLVPLLIVGPALIWLDRVEPEPKASRTHALLWGATVAAVVSALVNTLVQVGAGTAVSTVVSAPIIEEVMKGTGVLYAVRRRDVDSEMDGVIYAGWTALGFAVLENFLYFATAANEGMLAQVFVMRALLTPFAHPLFTAWTGYAIGRAVFRGRSPRSGAIPGLVVAIACHALWNGSLIVNESAGGAGAVLVVMLLFVVLFFGGVAVLVAARRREKTRFIQLVPWLAHRYGLLSSEVAVFSSWNSMTSARRRLRRSERSSFDGFHSALARLALLHERPGTLDPVDEQVLVKQLDEARANIGR